MAQQDNDPLGRFLNFGLGIFDRVIDRDNVEAELALARENRLAEERRVAETQARREPQAMGGFNQNTALLIGGAVIAALLIARL